MAERYGDELAAALPEVDAVVGFAGEGALADWVPVPACHRRSTAAGSVPERRGASATCSSCPGPRRACPWAYLKVAEGCDRACAFCAIPSFRGKQRSRTPESIEAEARGLVERRRRRAGARRAGPRLVRARRRRARARSPRCSGGSTRWPPTASARIRLLYLYPSEVRDPLVATMLELPTVVPYFDLSLQHADARAAARA